MGLDRIIDTLGNLDTLRYVGKVTRVVGMMVEGVMPNASIGATCQLEPPNAPPVLAEVVGLKDGKVIMMPLGPRRGLTVGTRMTMASGQAALQVGPGCLGRVLDGLGRPIDEKGPLDDVDQIPLAREPINPLRRSAIDRPMDFGIRAINGLLTIGEGQRVTVMAGTGVGKSTLLGMMARNARADVVVVALIGERGREVQEFVERDLQLSNVSADRVTVVAATSDESAALRLRAAFTATAIAEHFRNHGKRVLLLMDSLTRVVMAQREIGLSVGEPPAQRGYPPSAFAIIPSLLERAGTNERGSITAVYTTLIQGEDEEDPVADAVRGTVDGHIVLSRRLAEAGQYPAIDVARSLSRVMPQISEPEHQQAGREFRTLLNDFREVDDLMSLGAYQKGSNPRYDRALEMAGSLRGYISQRPDEVVSVDTAIDELHEVIHLADSAQVQAEPKTQRRSFRRHPSKTYQTAEEQLS
ncbi:FliI/YscN family ATPase [Persicimonas caeni]|uniref:FliI/YscN family ATPase n=1 Tax=Persicimonas caeni TaxID=2292766 RepID=A0A4Y6PSM2_PERCE|nr:FliI/YscN family ATPase [Persicimonas caeni]QDG51332.1 FliI/YscN family ATPase [Persicimonas caeni]QED32553.1 FliI/YscN family ATPase [Persicimonas caeni]